MTSSKETTGKGVFRHADTLEKVFELYRKSHHFSLKQKKPELFDTLARKIEHVSSPIIREAYGIYLNAPSNPKRHHPSYFVGIAMRLHMEDVDKYKKSSYIEDGVKRKNPPLFGKSI